MTAANKYIIQKVHLDVEVNSLESAFSFKENSSHWVHYFLLPAIERKFAVYEDFGQDKTLSVDRLEVEVISSGDMKKYNPELVAKKVEEALRKEVNQMSFSYNSKEKKQNTNSLLRTPKDKLLEGIQYYLQKGIAPWWDLKLDFIKEEDELIKRLQESEFRKKVLKLISNEPERKRWIWQVPISSSFALIGYPNVLTQDQIKILRPWNSEASFVDFLETLLAIISLSPVGRPNSVQQFKLTKSLYEMSLLEMWSTEVWAILKTLLSENLEDSVVVKLKQKVERNQFGIIKRKLMLEEEIFVKTSNISLEALKEHLLYSNQGGLLLLHPFIGSLFGTLGYLEDRILKKNKINKAIWLLYYLAHGNFEASESDLLLEKLICGVQPDYLHSPLDLPSKEECDESEKMLAAVLSHWTGLGNTSIDGLREGFIIRESKIDIKSVEKIVVHLDKKAQDVLISGMPWQTSMIKFSWCPYMFSLNY